MSFFKDVEFKLMFKVIFGILAAVFILFLISSTYDEFVEKPSLKKNPWKNFIENNAYTDYRTFFLEEQSKYNFSPRILDLAYCSTVVKDDREEVYNFIMMEKFNKLSSKSNFSKEEEMDAMTEIAAFSVLANTLYDNLNDENQKRGIVEFCYDAILPN